MTPPDALVAIVGGGLAGMVAAMRLTHQGVHDLRLFEARLTTGGRILSIDVRGQTVEATSPARDRFDLGPTWFWPEVQPEIDRLVGALDLPRFAQFEDGDLLIERSSHESPRRMGGFASSPPSMRLTGGTGALIAALHGLIDPGCIHTGHRVRRLRRIDGYIQLDMEGPNGDTANCRARHVLLALPPRLAARGLAFDPPLPDELARRWRETPTWMAPHAKYVAIYDRPFWRDTGLSGGARSAVGPMGEIHDVSMPGGHAALFGFLGVPARVRRKLASDALAVQCRAQLVRLFGECAGTPIADSIKDWALDPLTATDDDLDADGHPTSAPPATADGGPWRHHLTGIGSEWSPRFPGYLAGAVDAADRGVRHCLTTLDHLQEPSP